MKTMYPSRPDRNDNFRLFGSGSHPYSQTTTNHYTGPDLRSTGPWTYGTENVRPRRQRIGTERKNGTYSERNDGKVLRTEPWVTPNRPGDRFRTPLRNESGPNWPGSPGWVGWSVLRVSGHWDGRPPGRWPLGPGVSAGVVVRDERDTRRRNLGREGVTLSVPICVKIREEPPLRHMVHQYTGGN